MPFANFPNIQFQGALRPSQQLAVDVIQQQLNAGQHKLHIVAPPGSGKTVMGLYVWAHLIRRPALVLSPNSAIQAQWAKRTDLFHLDNHDHHISTTSDTPGLLTSLTYQSVTLPSRSDDNLDTAAIELWINKLIEKAQAEHTLEAEVWINDLQSANPDYYESRLSAYRKQVRDSLAISGQALETLHASALETLHKLRDIGIGLIILDECHHLMGHWGRVLADAAELLNGPVVLGLTATPPDTRGKLQEDIERYDTFFGPIDFQVPVPALVKEGNLAPYQDLAYFVRPSDAELQYIANADSQFHDILNTLRQPHQPNQPHQPQTDPDPNPTRVPTLNDWLIQTLTNYQLPTGPVKDWTAFYRRDPILADTARLYLLQQNIPLPENVPPPPRELTEEEHPELAILIPILDRYIRHGLRRSQNPQDHTLADNAIAHLRTLGYQVTETGTQACASPVSRVMAYAREKTNAALDILTHEANALGDNIRAIIVTDYEKTSAHTAEIANLLDEEAGGAVAAFRALLTNPTTDALDPILITGSTVLVDDDLLTPFTQQAEAWLTDHNFQVELTAESQAGFHLIKGRGADWCPRVYVSMITDLFQAGLTKCLVGTRGLLGEGWDANKVNVLIDLTTVTTSMTVNQLRGRSIRLDPQQPEKVADNWDIICVAGEFAKGLDDYHRFIAKHETLYGVTDDAAIEKGVGHVHAAFTELKPEGIEGALAPINSEMLSRAAKRNTCRDLWRIGEPFLGQPISAVELKPKADFFGFPLVLNQKDPWSTASLTLAVAHALLEALREAQLISTEARVRSGERAGGYVRVFLLDAPEDERTLFSDAMHEIFGPLNRPRYVIKRFVNTIEETFLSKLLPEIVGQYFRKKKKTYAMLHAVPAPLAKNKDLVAIFERHWNLHVSPGTAIYAHHGQGEQLVEQARQQGLTPHMNLHDKQIFL